MIRERAYNGLPGLPVLLVIPLAEAAAVWMLVMNIREESAPEIVAAAAAMVSNLLVVLCGDRNTQPVINTGTIYQ